MGTAPTPTPEVSQGGHEEIHAALRQVAGRNILMLHTLQEDLGEAINAWKKEDTSNTRGKMLALAQVYGQVGSINVDHLAAAVMYFNPQVPGVESPKEG